MRRMFKRLLIAVAAFLALVIILRLLFPLPPHDGRSETLSIPASDQTTLGGAIAQFGTQPRGHSGFRTLSGGFEAFAARMLLAQSAEESIDARYYIWHDDMTGLILLGALKEAAERGVRVRLLVDDNGIAHMDQRLAALNALPNFEIRIFNPFQLRSPKQLSFVFDFFRLNRRMHNKSFSVDGAFTIVGGRNIGDIYFESYGSGVYFDLDVLATGPAVDEVADDFDLYWASQSSFPLERIITDDGGDAALSEFNTEISTIRESNRFAGFRQAVEDSRIVQELLNGTAGLVWAESQLFSDDPEKGLRNLERDELLITRLFEAMPQPRRSFDLVSAYFIPGAEGRDYLTGLAENGVTVRTLTNAMEATDVAVVHSGYVKYRDALLEAGVNLFELKSQLEGRLAVDDFGVLSFSTSSLHAKALSIDEERVFIGSFNFDPRSASLNSEMGFLIESPELASEFALGFEGVAGSAAYTVSMDEDGGLSWHDPNPSGGPEIYTQEPGTNGFQRLLISGLGWLPIEWML